MLKIRKGLREKYFLRTVVLTFTLTHFHIYKKISVGKLKKTSKNEIIIFKMVAINKNHLLAALIAILRRRRRRCRNRINKRINKRLWVKAINWNRSQIGAFSTTFLLARQFDRTAFFE